MTRTRTAAIFIVLIAFLTFAQVFSQVQAVPSTTAATYANQEKGLMIHVHVIQDGLPSPSLSELRQSGFTLLGTQVYLGSGQDPLGWGGWSAIASWIKLVHNEGLRAFVLIGLEKASVKTITDLVKKAASIGADVIVLDELIARYAITQKNLKSILDAGLRASPSLQFIVVEYTPNAITNAYAWTSSYKSVRVATDNYYDMSTMDLGVKLATQYGKSPLVWLIFSPGSKDFPCYADLDSWMAYAKQLGLSALFWKIDEEGAWQTKWQSVLRF